MRRRLLAERLSSVTGQPGCGHRSCRSVRRRRSSSIIPRPWLSRNNRRPGLEGCRRRFAAIALKPIGVDLAVQRLKLERAIDGLPTDGAQLQGHAFDDLPGSGRRPYSSKP